MFTTPVEIPKYPFTINHQNRGLVIGSCFAQEIGSRLASAKFPTILNPHGILFNPASIGRAFNDIITQRRYTSQELVNHGGLWHSMHHHGSFSAIDPNEVLSRMNHPVVAKFDYIIVTLGTAWVYERNGEIVANCHKLPSETFTRRRLSVEECVDNLQEIAAYGLPVVITVSPVRHIKDGLVENSLSKSILRIAAAKLCEQYPNVHYFPAFEIMMDELRDYRFWADDMLHPSSLAAEYIWERFMTSFFRTDTLKLANEISRLKVSLSHRPIHPDSLEFAKFRKATQKKLENLATANPSIDFSKELSIF